MSGVSSYPKRLAPWLGQTRHAVLALVVCAAALTLVGWFRTEPMFRWVGLALQLLGVATVAYGIRKTRRLFELPGWLERFQSFWRSRPPIRLSSRTIDLSGTASATSSAEAELRAKPGIDAGLERRVRFLEEHFEKLEARFHASHTKLSSRLYEQATRLDVEAQERAQHDKRLDNLLRTAQAGGLDMSLVGLAWLFVGLVLATASVELQCFVTRWDWGRCVAKPLLGL